MAQVKVQIKTCFCCSLTVATVLIAIYTLLLYSLFIGLAGWALSDTVRNGDASYYESCLLEAEGKIRADNRKLSYSLDGRTTVIVEDSTSYHCSLGLYTAELKHPTPHRATLLIIDLFIFVVLLIGAVLLLIAMLVYVQWLLLPWLFAMGVDVLRGIISVLFIFIYSHGNLARIATGIFFLGLQFFHISLMMIIVAKFQRMHDKSRGIAVDGHHGDKVMMSDGRVAYPTMAPGAGTYAYSPTPMRHGDGATGGYYPSTQPYPAGSSTRVYQPYNDATVYRQQHHHQQQIGTTM